MSYSDFKKQAAVRRNAVGILVAGNMKKEAAFGAAGAQLSNSVKALLNALKQSYTSAKATQRPVSWFTRWLGKDLGKYGPEILKNPLVAGTGLGAAAGGLGFAAGKATNKKTAAAAFGAIPAIGNALSPAPAPATVAKPQQQAATAQNQQQQAQNQSGEQAPQADTNTIADLTASLNKITDVAKNSIKPSEQNTVAPGGETAQAEAVSGALKAASLDKAAMEKRANVLKALLVLLGRDLASIGVTGGIGAGIGALASKDPKRGAARGFGIGGGMALGGNMGYGFGAGLTRTPGGAMLGSLAGNVVGGIAGDRIAKNVLNKKKASADFLSLSLSLNKSAKDSREVVGTGAASIGAIATLLASMGTGWFSGFNKAWSNFDKKLGKHIPFPVGFDGQYPVFGDGKSYNKIKATMFDKRMSDLDKAWNKATIRGGINGSKAGALVGIPLSIAAAYGAKSGVDALYNKVNNK